MKGAGGGASVLDSTCAYLRIQVIWALMVIIGFTAGHAAAVAAGEEVPAVPGGGAE